MNLSKQNDDDVGELIEDKRDALERLAGSEYPIADTAAALLEIAEGSE